MLKVRFSLKAAQAISLKKEEQARQDKARKLRRKSSCEIGVVRYLKCSANIDKETKKEHRAVLAELQQN